MSRGDQQPFTQTKSTPGQGGIVRSTTGGAGRQGVAMTIRGETRTGSGNPIERWTPALADIAAVTPDLTPEEFGIRASKYRRDHPDWELTPTALCTHWGELGKGDVGQTVASMHAAEPEGWKSIAIGMLSEAEWSDPSIRVLLDGGWSRMSLGHRKAIQQRLTAKKTNSTYANENNPRDSRRDGVDA